MEINQETREKLQVAIKAIAEWAEKVISNIRAFFQTNWKRLKKVAIKWYQLEEEKKVVVRQRHKLDFTRRKMSHQVMDRRPRHMVRKIIRG